jgi:hypothetical protein
MSDLESVGSAVKHAAIGEYSNFSIGANNASKNCLSGMGCEMADFSLIANLMAKSRGKRQNCLADF